MPLTEQQITDTREQLLRQWRQKPLDEIVDHRQQLRTRSEQLGGYANRSAPQEIELEDLVLEITTLDDLIPEVQTSLRSQQLDRIREAGADPANREDGAPTGRPSPGGHRAPVSSRDPWEGVNHVTMRTEGLKEWRARGHAVLERAGFEPAAGDQFARLLDDDREGGPAGIYATVTSHPAYRSAFLSYLRNPTRAPLFWSDEERFAVANVETSMRSLSLGTASLGYMVPFQLDPNIVLANSSSANPFRRFCRVEQTTSSTWNGVWSAGVNSAWLAEGSAASDNSPTVNQIQIVPQKAASWVYGSFEALGDTDFGTQLPRLLQDSRDRLEVAAFTTGTGGTVPTGILNALGTGTATSGTNIVSTVAASGAFALWETLAPRYRHDPARPAVFGNLTKLDALRQSAQFSGSTMPILQGTRLQVGESGVEAAECSAMTTGTAAGSQALVAGDWTHFILAERIGVQLIYDPLVKGTAATPIGSAGWFAWWRVGSNVTTVGSGDGPFKVLKL